MSRAASPAELFEHSSWVLELARSLVGEAAAGDVAQETMIAALRRPPATDRAIRPWLARVVRNFASRYRRSERRRIEHERRVAHRSDDGVPSAAEVAEAGDTLRVLIAELNELESPLREVVTLRYVRGANSSEIASQLGVPAGTVRWRLKQGLEALRARLDARHGGDRDRWAGAIAIAVGARSTAAAAEVAILAKPVLVGAALVLLTLGAWGFWARGAGDRSPSVVRAVGGAAASSTYAYDENARVTDEQAAERRDVDTHRAPAVEARPELGLPRLDADRAGVYVTVTDRAGSPIPHAQVRWSLAHDAFGFTRDDGFTAFSFRPPVDGATLEIRVEARGLRATRLLRVGVAAGQWTDLGRVSLPGSYRVVCRVVDESGAAVADARVFATRGDLGQAVETFFENGPRTWRDYDIEVRGGGSGGRFTVSGLPEEPIRIWAVGPSTFYACSELLESRPRSELSLVLRPLSEGRVIFGCVVDRDGQPVTSARVRRIALLERERDPVGARRPSWFDVDASGRFEMPARLGVDYDVVVVDDEDRWQDVEYERVRAGQRLDVRLTTPR